MKSLGLTSLAVLVTMNLVCVSVPARGQIGIPKALGGKGKEAKESKEAKEAAAEGSTLDKSYEDFYLDMKAFAEGLYNKQIGEGENRRDSDFKRRVDSAYEEIRRRDAEKAYRVNLSAHSEIRHVIEDRYRWFSGLYDNLLVQDLLNRTGQSIVPKETGRLYTFKLLADPIPRAETLSTGTIYVSTGLIALLNTKAQLAYVLAHEAAHVYHNDYRTEVMLDFAAEEYASKMKANKEQVQQRLALFVGLTGGIVGGLVGRSAQAATIGAIAGAGVGALAGGLIERTGPIVKDWNKVQEDEADRTAFDWVLNANQNVQEIPKVYQALKDVGDRDDRVTLGFLGRSNRVRERAKKVDEMITLEKGKADFGKRVFQTSDPDFDILMAEVKRDNGILAFQYDMIDVARDNLEKAVAIKTTDPTALYFYAKILMETGKTDEERAKANEYFRRAAAADHRNLNYGAQLHRAVALLTPDATNSEKQQAVSLLKQYVEGYYLSSIQDKQTDSYPPHLETIYDYMSRLGEFQYVLDGKKVMQQHEQASKLAQSTSGMALKSDEPSPAAIPVSNPSSVPPKPKPAPKKQ